MATKLSSPVRCEVRCWEGLSSPRLQSTPLRAPLRNSSPRGSPLRTPLRTPRLSWAREQSSIQKWKKSLRKIELSDSAKTLKNIQTFKKSQEVIRDQAEQIKHLTNQTILLGKEARSQEEEQEKLYQGIQQLDQENKQLQARADLDKERTWEVERMMKVIEERVKEMEKEDVRPNGEQEKHPRERIEELKKKVAELVEQNNCLKQTIEEVTNERLTSGPHSTPITKKTPLRKTVALRNMNLSQSLLPELNHSFEVINESCEISFGVMAREEDAPLSLEEEMQALRNHNKPLLLIIIRRLVRMLSQIQPGKRQGA